jgi:hypothetical protein
MKIKINADFRLLDVSLEIYALEDHYKLVEKQIMHLSHMAEEALDEYRKKENLTPEDPEWHFAEQEFDYKVEFLLPRFFWGTFIVSLYAVFETGVTEIARLMQKSMKQGIAINDIRGDFLERAKKYYKNVLRFDLYCNNKDWVHIKRLTDIRHAIAHANGRIDMLNDNAKTKIKKMEKQNIGVSSNYNYLLIDSHFSKKVFSAVCSILRDLVDRYKEWDSNQKPV